MPNKSIFEKFLMLALLLVWVGVFAQEPSHEVLGKWVVEQSNDKSAFPVGVGDEHSIDPSTEIEYQIRFQNTGTDTVFNLAIRDTLSEFLDLSTLRPGASSHNFEYEVYGKRVLKILFPNILLPDSLTGGPASQGYVKFKITPRMGVPPGTRILNSAAIHFDFDPPIFTNTVFHTMEEDSTMVNSEQEIISDVKLTVFPNPFSTATTVKMEGVSHGHQLIFRLFDIHGKAALQQAFTAPGFEISDSGLQPGFYFFKIEDNGRQVASGKLVKI